MIPKGGKYDNKVFKGRTGVERVDELMEGTDIKTTFLPSTIGIIDIDGEFVNQLNSDRLSVVSQSQKQRIPAIIFGSEKWGEFSKTWKYTDKDKNVILPIITIRKTETQFGSRLGDNRYFVSNQKNYEYMRVPVMGADNRMSFDIYRVPNPTPIDITYEVKLFSNFSRDLNAFDELFIRNFQDAQFYINVKGSYMPCFMDGNSDDTVIDVNKNTLLVKTYNIKVKGFIHKEEEFDVIKANERIVQITEINKKEVERKTVPRKIVPVTGPIYIISSVTSSTPTPQIDPLTLFSFQVTGGTFMDVSTNNFTPIISGGSVVSDYLYLGSSTSNTINVIDSGRMSFSSGLTFECDVFFEEQSNPSKYLALKAGSFFYNLSNKINVGYNVFSTETIYNVSGSQFNYYPVGGEVINGLNDIPLNKWVKITYAYDPILGRTFTMLDRTLDQQRYRYRGGSQILNNTGTTLQLFNGYKNCRIKNITMKTGRPNLLTPSMEVYVNSLPHLNKFNITFDHIDPSIVLPITINVNIETPTGGASSVTSLTLSNISKFDYLMDMPSLKPSIHTLIIRASSNNQQFYSNNFRVATFSQSSPITINSGNTISNNNVKFFPRFVYNALPSDFTLLSNMGINVIFNDFNINTRGVFVPLSARTTLYESITAASASNMLLLAAANGIQPKLTPLTSNTVSGLCGWYSADEPSGNFNRLFDSYNMVKMIDTEKFPIVAIQNNFTRLQELSQCVDILGVDPYPIPNVSLRMVYDATNAAVNAVSGLKPVWCVIPQYEQKQPSLTEMRCMVWLAIAAKASGVGLFEWDHRLPDPSAVPPYSVTTGWYTNDYSGLVENINIVFNELATLEYVLVTNNSNVQPTLSTSNLAYHVLVKDDGVNKYLIIANDSRQSETNTIIFPTSNSVTGVCLLDSETLSNINIINGSVSITLPPLGIAIYDITGL